MYKQIKLKKDNVYQVCWMELKKPFKIGDFIRPKNDSNFWEVIKVWDTLLEKNEINQDWDAGGLNEKNRIT